MLQLDTLFDARQVVKAAGFEVQSELGRNPDGIRREYLARSDGARAEITVYGNGVSVAYYGLSLEELVQLDRAKAEQHLQIEQMLIADGAGDEKRAAQLEAALAA